MKVQRTTFARTDARPELKTVEKVPSQFPVRVLPTPSLCPTLLPTCLQTSMPVLIVAFNDSMSLVTFDTASVVRNDARTFKAKNMPTTSV